MRGAREPEQDAFRVDVLGACHSQGWNPERPAGAMAAKPGHSTSTLAFLRLESACKPSSGNKRMLFPAPVSASTIATLSPSSILKEMSFRCCNKNRSRDRAGTSRGSDADQLRQVCRWKIFETRWN